MLQTSLLLLASNLFMTAAWYGHLKDRETALWKAVLVSWGIAFFEYCLQVPANRLGYNAGMPAAQLKTLQEVITLLVFTGFAWAWLGEVPKWNTLVGFGFIVVGAAFVFAPWQSVARPG